jgi:CDP-diglyceride synthetase
MSATVTVTSITSFIGFMLNGLVLVLVLLRGRQTYHYLFAGYLLICALWDLGIFLSMIRNDYVNELPTYGTIVWWPCTFMIAIIYTFTCAYLDQPKKWRTILLWVACTVVFLLGVFGLGGRMIGVYDYSWGHIYRPDSLLLISTLLAAPFMAYFGLSALWYLFRAHGRESSPVRKRHILYILVSFTIIQLAISKVAILYGLDNAFLMPACMLLNDIAAAIVGVAIVKDRLLDITLIVKKTAIYSVLAAVAVLVFSVAEHLLATYVGELLGASSFYTYLVAVAAVIVVVMPFRNRVERTVDRFFAAKKVAF